MLPTMANPASDVKRISQPPRKPPQVIHHQRLRDLPENYGPASPKLGPLPGRGPQRPLQLDRRTAPQAPILESLAALQPLQLQAVTAPREAQLWNHWVQRYHPLKLCS